MKPHVGGDGVPRCSENECPSYDGKRCELIGCRPSLICEPAVIDMADRLRTPPVTGAAAMREAAAKVADDYDCLYADGRGAAVAECQESIAAAIRARANEEGTQ